MHGFEPLNFQSHKKIRDRKSEYKNQSRNSNLEIFKVIKKSESENQSQKIRVKKSDQNIIRVKKSD